MNKYKEYFYLLLSLVFIIIITFYKVYDGYNLFVGGDTLSPVAFRNGINNIISNSLNYPLWFPWIFGGMPSIHSFINVSHLYYPHTFFLLLNSVGLPWVWNFLLHLIFCGLGMYSLLKFMGCSRYSSFIASSLFMISPYFIAMTSYGHGSQVMTASYIPWIILFLFKIFDRISVYNLSIFSLLIGLQLQRAHIQIAYYTWMMIGLFILLKNYNYIKNKACNIVFLMKHNLLVCLSLFGGFLISLNIYLPALKYVANSTRSANDGGAGLEYATQWSLSLKEAITIFVPSFFGFGGKLYWGDMPFTDYPNYFGIILFVFSIIGYFKSTIKYEYRIFFLLTVLFSFCICLGSNFISFYKIFYDYFPFFNKFRVPVYIIIITFFSFFVFSAFGIDYLYSELKLKKIKLKETIIFFSIILTLFIILIPLSDHIVSSLRLKHNLLNELIFNDLIQTIAILLLFVLLIISLIVKKSLSKKIFYFPILFICLFDYSRINHEIIYPNKHIPHKKIIQSKEYLENYLYESDIVTYLKTDHSKYRIFDVLGPQNRWTTFNIENVQGYHPAKLNIYNNFLDKIKYNGHAIWPEGILKLLNVKYLLMPFDDYSNDKFEIVKKGSLHYFGNQYSQFDGKVIPYNIYKYKNNYPRLFFIKKLQTLDKNEIYNKILDSDFDPKELSYISDYNDHDIKFEYSLSSNVDLISWSADMIEFSTNTNVNSFLLFSEIYYPDGWQLTDGNKFYDIYNINELVRGALIPSGEKTFKMYYEPTEVYYSRLISIISFIFIMLLTVIGIYRKKQYNV